MRLNNCPFALVVACVLAATGCIEGPVGPEGPNGEQGPVGPEGDPGTANVIHSDWLTLDTALDSGTDVLPNGFDGSTAVRTYSFAAPEIKQEILDAGSVDVYFGTLDAEGMVDRVVTLPVSGLVGFVTQGAEVLRLEVGEVVVMFFNAGSTAAPTFQENNAAIRYVITLGGVEAQ